MRRAADRGVDCWGNNGNGQLGDNSVGISLLPTPVLGGLASVTSLSAGLAHTCAVLAAGAVSCWGGNANGELGNGTFQNASTPVSVAW